LDLLHSSSGSDFWGLSASDFYAECYPSARGVTASSEAGARSSTRSAAASPPANRAKVSGVS
jgi:hypothetical protein